MQSRIFSNNNRTPGGNNFSSSEIYSQGQLIKQRRGASIIRNSSKTKYAESMSKFRKDFIKDSYVQFDLDNTHKQNTMKEESAPGTGINFDEELGVE